MKITKSELAEYGIFFIILLLIASGAVWVVNALPDAPTTGPNERKMWPYFTPKSTPLQPGPWPPGDGEWFIMKHEVIPSYMTNYSKDWLSNNQPNPIPQNIGATNTTNGLSITP
jgi:hypothetical protein